MTIMNQAQRQQLCLQYKANPHMTQSQLAQWAKETFDLAKVPTQPTISHILRRKHEYENLSADELTTRRQRSVRFPALDTALVNWLYYCQANQIRVVGETIREQAHLMADLMGLSRQGRPSFSNGWLQSFQQRHGILSSRRPQYESANAMETYVATPRPVESKQDLQQAIKAFAVSDVYVMDETCLLYELGPDLSTPSSRKMTMILCTNADASDRVDPFFVCEYSPYLLHPDLLKTSTPTASTEMKKRKKTMEEQEEEEEEEEDLSTSMHAFTANKKTWVTTSVFRNWLRTFEARMRAAQRHVVLILDDAVTHNVSQLDLRHVTIIVVSSRHPDVLPLNREVMMALRRRYRSRQLAHVLKQPKTEEALDFSLDPLCAMDWIALAWRLIPPEVLLQGFALDNVDASSSSNSHEALLDQDLLTSLQLLTLSWTLDDVLMPSEETKALASEATQMTDQDFVDSAIEAKELLPKELQGDVPEPLPIPIDEAPSSRRASKRLRTNGAKHGVREISANDAAAVRRVIELATAMKCPPSTLQDLVQLERTVTQVAGANGNATCI